MMILTYLQDEGYVLSKTVLQDEANIKAAAGRERSSDLKAFRKAVRGTYELVLVSHARAGLRAGRAHGTAPRPVLNRWARTDGDFGEAEKLVPKLGLKNVKSLLYAVHKQQYLEWIEGGEHYRAQVGFEACRGRAGVGHGKAVY